MIQSMTGFCAVSRELSQGTLNIELRSVNHRYLDIQFRVPEELRFLEQPMREAVVARFSRGKVECRLGFNALVAADKPLQLNPELLARLIDLNRQIQVHLPGSQGLSVADVARWPGIFGPAILRLEDIHESGMNLLK